MPETEHIISDSFHHPTIAIVEDDADDRDFICAALRSCSKIFDIDIYKNGTEFLESLEAGKRPFNLVITDIRMPMVSGFDVIKKIREKTSLKNIPVVVLSTSDNDEDIELAKNLGAAAYYIKPHTLDEYCNITEEIAGSLPVRGKTDFGNFLQKFLSWLGYRPNLSPATLE